MGTAALYLRAPDRRLVPRRCGPHRCCGAAMTRVPRDAGTHPRWARSPCAWCLPGRTAGTSLSPPSFPTPAASAVSSSAAPLGHTLRARVLGGERVRRRAKGGTISLLSKLFGGSHVGGKARKGAEQLCSGRSATARARTQKQAAQAALGAGPQRRVCGDKGGTHLDSHASGPGHRHSFWSTCTRCCVRTVRAGA